MSRKIIVLLIGSILTAFSAFAQLNNDEALRIIQKRCSQCHPPDRLNQAMQRGDNFDEIITKMIRLGARIDSNEQEVLGVFWTGQKNPTDDSGAQSRSITRDPLGEYRAILERRCTGCHGLDIVEKAMMEGRSAEELVVMMRKRGATVTLQEKSVLDTFWGSPFKAGLPK